MKILIVDDDEGRSQQLYEHISSSFSEATVAACRSYNSGVNQLIEDTFDLVLLDMSLPTFDLRPDEPGGRFRHFGGWDILCELQRLHNPTKAIIVTQFESFGDEGNFISLSELMDKLGDEFPDTYRGTIFFKSANSGWKETLFALVAGLKPTGVFDD